MYKKFVIFCLLISLAFGLSFSSVFASHKEDSNDQSKIPERTGIYDDPDHPGIKVAVFVHPERVEKTSAAVLVCELPDPDSNATVGAASWHLPSNWTYNLNLGSVPSSVGSANLPTIAGNGFSDWTAGTGGKVTFAKGADTTVAKQAYDLKNIIAWNYTRGTALGITYIRYYSSSGLVVDVDTIMNKKFAWSWSNSSTCADSNSYDAENILEHEQGHWVGLKDEYDGANYQHATMFGYGSKGEVKKVTLSTGDNTGAFSIYNP